MAGAFCYELNQPMQINLGHIEIILVLGDDNLHKKNIEAMQQQVYRMGDMEKK